jgi:hypothetical protein
MEQIPHSLLLGLLPAVYSRWRQTYIMVLDVRVVLYLIYECYTYTPDILRHVVGGTTKLLMYVISHHMFYMQRPKAALYRGLVLWGPTFFYIVYVAEEGATGVEGLLFKAWTEGGWLLAGVALFYATAQMLLVMAVAFVVDVSCRRAFLRQEAQGLQQ